MRDVPGNLHSVRSPCELGSNLRLTPSVASLNAVQRLGAAHGRNDSQRALIETGDKMG
jgi:hypothetical protein